MTSVIGHFLILADRKTDVLIESMKLLLSSRKFFMSSYNFLPQCVVIHKNLLNTYLTERGRSPIFLKPLKVNNLSDLKFYSQEAS